jgi:hypothetical protein
MASAVASKPGRQRRPRTDSLSRPGANDGIGSVLANGPPILGSHGWRSHRSNDRSPAHEKRETDARAHRITSTEQNGERFPRSLALRVPGTPNRAPGVRHRPSCVADGGRDRYGRIAGDLTEEVAIAESESPFNYSVHVHDLEWLQERREIESFFIEEVDRDKIVLAGSALD